MNKRRLSILILIVVGVIIIISVVYRTPTNDQDSSLGTVTFCGKEYRAPVSVIYGKDVVSRIAEIASADPAHEFCEIIIKYATDNILDTEVDLGSDGNYIISIDSHLFFLDTKRMMLMKAAYEDIVDFGQF